MTDDLDFDPTADDALSAYLASDLDEEQTAAVEARLADDPAAAARLDALADALVELGGPDDVAEPDGFAQRLDARLAAERAQLPVSLDERRARRSRSTSWWAGVGSVAAAVVAVAVVGGNSLLGTQMGGEDAGVAMEESAGGDGATAYDASGDALSAAPPGPLVLDENVRLDGPAALKRRYVALDESGAILGTAVADAPALADQFTAALGADTTVAQMSKPAPATAGDADAGTGEAAVDDTAKAEEFATEARNAPAAPSAVEGGGGAAAVAGASRALARNAAQCLPTITEGAAEPLVPVRVETVRYRGAAAFAYVFVTATPKADVLDRTEVWIVKRADCATIVFQQY